MVSARTFTEVVPYHEYKRREGGWRDGMVTGNGHTGVVCSGSPYSETLIYQNIEFIMPSREPRETPEEVTSQLHEARQAVINFDDTWNVHDRNRTFLYCYHPALQLRLTLPQLDLWDICAGQIMPQGKWQLNTGMQAAPGSAKPSLPGQMMLPLR